MLIVPCVWLQGSMRLVLNLCLPLWGVVGVCCLQANHALYQRLVAIRPSKDISRETLEAGHRMNETYRANCAQFKPSSPTHKAPAGTSH